MEFTASGVVDGQTIQFAQSLGLKDGQRVEVTITSTPPVEPWGEGLRRCAGALADSWTDEDDRILEQIYLDRKRSSRKLPE